MTRLHSNKYNSSTVSRLEPAGGLEQLLPGPRVGPAFFGLARQRRAWRATYDSGMPSPPQPARARPAAQRSKPTAASPSPLPEAPAPAPAPADQAESAARVLRRFRMVFNAVKTHFQQVEKQAGIGGAQVWALSLIAARPGIGVGGLAEAMDIHQTTASNLVKALVGLELVVAQRQAPDRRAVQLHPTPAARKVLARAPGPFSGVLPEALARLDPQTLARLDADLGTLITALAADESAGGIPLGQM